MARREALIRGAAAPGGEHEPAPGAPAAADPAVPSTLDEPRLSLFDAADLAAADDPLAADEMTAEPSPAATGPVPDVPGDGPAVVSPDDDPPLAELVPDDYVAEDVTFLPEDATVLPEDVTADPDATVLEPAAAARPRTRRKKEPAPRATPPPPASPSPPPPVDHGAATDPGHALAPHRSAPFVFDPLRPYRGVVRRFFVVYRHVLGLLAGGAAAYVRALPRERRHGLKSWFPRLTASVVWPFLDRNIRRLTFAQQLRRRLEILGPTYIKLGQIMAIREDLLPRSITGELANLFDRLPAIPFVQVREIIENSLGQPLEELYSYVDEKPLGSASIAQAHRAETLEGEPVVVKVIKPGVAEMIESDLTLLGMVGGLLQWVLPRYQPRQIIHEFSAYTRKEVDYTFEADNAETFAANFADLEDVAFPRIHRSLSSGNVLTMEFMRGIKPGSDAAASLTQDERARVIDVG
ncbi:MAG TPA: AarF/UbiB family protein, partial [Geminicoccaceae bacterium]